MKKIKNIILIIAVIFTYTACENDLNTIREDRFATGSFYQNASDLEVFNIGTGRGSSVLEVIHAFEKVTDQKLNYKIVERRAGDVVSVYADTVKANTVLGWSAEKTMEEALASSWKWEKKVRNIT